MKLLLLCSLLAAVGDDQRSEDFFGRIVFDTPAPDSDEGRRVVEILTKKENWTGAFRALEQKYLRFPDDLKLEVDFRLGGDEVGWGAANEAGGKVRFNLDRLIEHVKKSDALQAKLKEAQLRGQRAIVKVPSMRMDRLIYHELTHVLQRGYDAPAWFNEGMAQLIADDPNSIAAFVNGGKPVQAIDVDSSDRNHAYARGHLFWKWLDYRGQAKKAAEMAIAQRKPWKEVLEAATNRSWAVLLDEEQEWSAKEVERLRK